MTQQATTAEPAVPSAVWAERELIGACLIGPPIVAKIRTRLNSADFWSARHAAIFGAIERIADRDELPVLTLVLEELERTGQLAHVGGFAALADLAANVPCASEPYVTFYVDQILEASKKRRLLHAGQSIAQSALDGNRAFEDAMRAASATVGEVARTTGVATGLTPLDMAMLAVERRAARTANGDESALAFGLLDLDRETAGGARPGQLIVIGGRPGVGKSALLRDVARSFARRGPVLFASNEMTAEQIVDRDLSVYARLPLPEIARGRYTDAQTQALIAAEAEIGALPIYNHVDGGMSSASLRAHATELMATVDLKAVVVDYLQLLADPGERSLDRVSHASRELKRLALDLNVPVIVGSQLSRANERDAADKRPSLIDLRDSGEIEQNADVVFLLYRESYYWPTEEEWRKAGRQRNGDTYPGNEAEIRIEKQRQGPSGITCRVLWVPSLATFRNLAHAEAVLP